jgi:hypothetical protein
MYNQQDNPHNLWLPGIEDWGTIEERAYEVILDQATSRFEEYSSISEDITSKAWKLMTTCFTFLAGFLGLSLSKMPSTCAIVAGSCLYLVLLWYISSLLIPKEIHLRGLKPSEAFPERLDDKHLCAPEEQVRLVYYKIIVKYEDKITKLRLTNDCRSQKYKQALRFSIALILGTIVYGSFLIYSHP